MYCVIKGHNFEHELQTIGQIFYKNQGFNRVADITADGVCLVSSLENGKLLSELYIDGSLAASESEKLPVYETGEHGSALRFAVKNCMFRLLQDATGKNTPWGSLTGIRPTKIMRELIEMGCSEEAAIEFMRKKYYVSEEKANLLAEIVSVQKDILRKRGKDDISVYIGIPFCPTRCHYCSFSAYPIDKYGKYIDDYIEALIDEMHSVKQNIAGKNIRTVYIGGGTPTVLDADRLEKLLYHVSDIFNLAGADEYSVEAGRPDTITPEKLKVLKKHGVSRISINPQTLKDETLARIGRKHTAQQFFDAFQMAREAGFGFINVDLIAGLPGESLSDFKSTLEQICRLSPENLTVHTLAIKRASKFKEDILDKGAIFECGEVAGMLDAAYSYAENSDMHPYYLYRQKNMVDTFENVGYAKKGFESIYNIHIMEETETIIALGAGAISKLVYPEENRIERIANVKDVVEYIKRRKND